MIQVAKIIGTGLIKAGVGIGVVFISFTLSVVPLMIQRMNLHP